MQEFWDKQGEGVCSKGGIFSGTYGKCIVSCHSFSKKPYSQAFTMRYPFFLITFSMQMGRDWENLSRNCHHAY